MSLPARTNKTAALGCAVAALMLSQLAIAGEIRISGGNCMCAVHVFAQDARLSDVLKGMARELDFELSFNSESDPVVNINTTRDPSDLVAFLARSANLSMTQTQNPRCPSRNQIVKLWVLPDGNDRTARSAAEQARTWRPQEKPQEYPH
jgi:hypothetical protein